MSKMKFTKDHEWVRMDSDDAATVGITDYAQQQLGDLVFVELPEAGRDVTRGEEVVVIESVKAAAEVKAPISGTVTEANQALADEPVKVNEDPLGEGWFFKLKIADPGELEGLLDEAAYNSYLEELG